MLGLPHPHSIGKHQHRLDVVAGELDGATEQTGHSLLQNVRLGPHRYDKLKRLLGGSRIVYSVVPPFAAISIGSMWQ